MLHSEIKDRKAHKHSLHCKESTIFLTNDHHLLSYLFLPQPLLLTRILVKMCHKGQRKARKLKMKEILSNNKTRIINQEITEMNIEENKTLHNSTSLSILLNNHYPNRRSSSRSYLSEVFYGEEML